MRAFTVAMSYCLPSSENPLAGSVRHVLTHLRVPACWKNGGVTRTTPSSASVSYYFCPANLAEADTIMIQAPVNRRWSTDIYVPSRASALLSPSPI